MKRIMCLSLVLCSMLAAIPVQAAEMAVPVKEVASETVMQANVRTPEVKWYYREYNGKQQMRLWSVTESKWLTDWIDY